MSTIEKDVTRAADLQARLAEKEAELQELRSRLRAWEESYGDIPKRDALFTSVSGREVAPLYTPLDRVGAGSYLDTLSFPGEYPFTRGPYTTMYRTRLWTMRQFAGFATAEDTNRRYKYLLDHGQTGLSVAFDFPTLMGYDSDHPRSLGEVGVCGVAISSLADMETLFDGIPLDEVSVSMTINGPAIILFCFYVAAAEKQGVPAEKLRGTVQNDILKEYQAQHAWVFPPEPALRAIVDMFAWCSEHAPKYNPISISGYHIREAGATAGEELAFTLKNGFEYVERGIARGLDVDAFAPTPVLLLRRPQRLLRGGRQVPGGPAHLGAAPEGGLRLHQPRVVAPQDPRPDGGGDPHGPAAREQHRAGRLSGPGGGAGGHPVPPHQLHGRDAGPSHRKGGAHRAQDPAGARLRDRHSQRR